MSKPKGGRGKKAEHPTTVTRIPQGISKSVSVMAYIYRDCGSDLLEILLSNLLLSSTLKKETRDWTQINRLLDAIEGELPAGFLNMATKAISPTLANVYVRTKSEKETETQQNSVPLDRQTEGHLG